MENTPDNVIEPKKNILFEVTSFSKILAALMFIILPFVGFWFGYNFNANLDSILGSTAPVEVTEASLGSTTPVTMTEASSTCLSGENGDRSLEPVVITQSSYSLEYTGTDDAYVAPVVEDGALPYEYSAFPYNPKCLVSLVERSNQGTKKVIVPDLLKLTREQNLPDGLLGTPRPYIFRGDNLIFGGNGYEGMGGGFYSFDVKTQKFAPLTDRRIGSGPVVLSPNNERILIGNGDRSILIIDINTLTTKTVTLTDINEGETYNAICEMGCDSKIGWLDEKTVWYAIHKKNDSSSQNTFLRMSSRNTLEN